MKQTEKLGLRLFEGKDHFNYEWLNDNCRRIESAIHSRTIVWSKVPLNELPICDLEGVAVYKILKGQWIPYYHEGHDVDELYIGQGDMITDGKYVGQIVSSEGEPYAPDMLFIKNIELLGNPGGNSGGITKLYRHDITLLAIFISYIFEIHLSYYSTTSTSRSKCVVDDDGNPISGLSITATDLDFISNGYTVATGNWDYSTGTGFLYDVTAIRRDGDKLWIRGLSNDLGSHEHDEVTHYYLDKSVMEEQFNCDAVEEIIDIVTEVK